MTTLVPAADVLSESRQLIATIERLREELVYRGCTVLEERQAIRRSAAGRLLEQACLPRSLTGRAVLHFSLHPLPR